MVSGLVNAMRSFRVLALRRRRKPPLILAAEEHPLLLISFRLGFRVRLAGTSLPMFLLFSFSHPVLCVPRGSGAVVTGGYVLYGSLSFLVHRVVCVTVARRYVYQVFYGYGLGLYVYFFAFVLVAYLSYLYRVDICLFVKVSAMVASFVYAGRFVYVIVDVGQTSPSSRGYFLVYPIGF